MVTTMLHSSFVKPNPFSIKSSCTPSHPQLRDLLVCPPESPDSVVVAVWDALASHDLCQIRPTTYTRLKFAPSTIATGCGLIIAGGQSGELALRSSSPASSSSSSSSNWLHELIPQQGGNINNSIFISPSPLSATRPRVLVSNNDESVKVYEVKGDLPEFNRSKRRRKREWERGGAMLDDQDEKIEEESDEEDRRMKVEEEENRNSGEENPEEEGIYSQGGECSLHKLDTGDIHLHTAVNHSSVSPDGKKLVVVGDTNEIFLFDVLNNGGYDLVHVFEGSNDASFSSDWSGTSDKFAVASQDGFVHVYDIRNLPPVASISSTTSRANKLATIKTSQSGPAGAARKVKFSSNNVSSELLAFTEHQSVVQIVCARTFDRLQIINVPTTESTILGSTATMPPLRSRTTPSNYTSARSRSRPFPPPSHPNFSPNSNRHSNTTNSNSREFISSMSYYQEESRSTLRDPAYGTNSIIDRQIEDEDELRLIWARRLRGNHGNHYLDHHDEEQRAGGGGSDWNMNSEARAYVDHEVDETMERDEARSNFERRRLDRILRDEIEDEEEVEEEEEEERDLSGESDDDDDDDDEEDDQAEECPSPLLLPSPPPVVSASINRRPVRIPSQFAAGQSISSASGMPILSGYAPLNFTRLNQPPTILVPTVAQVLNSTSYFTNSTYFPLESTPSDLLGLDWNEFGERIVVATEGRVWEWEVEGRARRCFGSFSLN